MKTLKTRSLYLMLPVVLAACGAQVVDFPEDAGPTGGEDGAVGDAAAMDADAAGADAGRADGSLRDAAGTDATALDAAKDALAELDAADAGAADGSGDAAPASDASDANAQTTDASDAATTDAGDAASGATTDASDAATPDAADAASRDASDAATPDAADAATLDAADAASLDASDAAATDASDAGRSDASDAAALDAGDATVPEVVATNPGDAAMNVSISEILTATFNETMNPSSINATTFTLRQGADAAVDSTIAGIVTYADGGTTGTFVPSANLAINTLYTATISTGAQDLFGHALGAPFIWDFTTSACAQAPVVLGAANGFAVLAYSPVTSTGPTSVMGDIGLWTGSSITGFPPGTLVGNEYIADPTSSAAMGALTTAYNDAAGRTLCAITVAGNIGGTTVYPGLYKSTSSLAVSSGNLTIDAQGDPDAVFIFQMASTLTVSPGLQVILSGGAQAANIFWQVGSSATLNTTSVFQGTILAAASISLDTGATLNGRAFAENGAVTMQSNTIVTP